MSDRTCPICGEQSKDSSVCHKCWRSHRKHLDAMPSLDAELVTTITRQDKLGPASDIKARSLFGPMPVNLDAADIHRNMRAVLTSWVRVLCDDYGHTYPADTITAMSAYLSECRPARTHAAAVELFEEVETLHAEALAAIDYPDERGRIKVGPCPEVDEEGEPCGGLLWAHVPTSRPTFMRCDCCTREWSSVEWAHLGRRIARKVEQQALQRSYGA